MDRVLYLPSRNFVDRGLPMLVSMMLLDLVPQLVARRHRSLPATIRVTCIGAAEAEMATRISSAHSRVRIRTWSHTSTLTIRIDRFGRTFTAQCLFRARQSLLLP